MGNCRRAKLTVENQTMFYVEKTPDGFYLVKDAEGKCTGALYGKKFKAQIACNKMNAERLKKIAGK